MRLRKLSNHWMLSICTIALLVSLAGCVYLRLLEFKNQLVDFDKHFSTQVENSHFVLHFKDPMLYEKDITYLTEVDPSKKEPYKSGEKWIYAFAREAEKGQKAPEGPDLIFTMTTNDEDQLNSTQFSEVFLQIIPHEFLEYSLRSLGKAKVDTNKRHVYAKIENVDEDILNLPTQDEVVETLGEPNQVENQKDITLLVYKYQLRGTESTGEEDDPGKAEARLQFSHECNLLVEAKCRFAGLKLSIDYRKWLKKDDKPIASS